MIGILKATSAQYPRRTESHDTAMSTQAWKDNCHVFSDSMVQGFYIIISYNIEH